MLNTLNGATNSSMCSIEILVDDFEMLTCRHEISNLIENIFASIQMDFTANGAI